MIKFMRSQKGSLAIILGVIVLVLLAGGVYIYYLTQQKSAYYSSLQQDAKNKIEKYNQETSKQVTSTPKETTSSADLKSYSNTQFKFSIQYPSNWQYKENDPPTPNLNKYHVVFFSSDGNSVLDLAVISGSYEEAKKGLGATKEIVDEEAGGLSGFTVLDEKGNKSLSYFPSPFFSNETYVLTYLTKSNYETLESIKNSLKFSK